MVREQLPLLLAEAGLMLSHSAVEQLAAYHALLLDWNTRMDLTNVPEEQMAARHYADSLLPLLQTRWFMKEASLIDVGTGAGFPGLPLAIARPDMQVVLLDALKKRCVFLEAVVEQLALSNVKVVHARAEDAARGSLRERFDLACARAVAPARVLLEYLLPFVRVDGRVLMWKGPTLAEEMADAKNALHVLGGAAEQAFPLPLAEYDHYVQPIKKRAATPAKYPRKAGTPSKTPL